MDLFLDDIKEPEWFENINQESLVVARTAELALVLMDRLFNTSRKEKLDTLYLDHDLGPGMSGHQFLVSILKKGIRPRLCVIISWNPAGIRRLRDLCNDHAIPVRIGGLVDAPNHSH